MALLRKPYRPKTLPIRHPWESRFKSAGNRFSEDQRLAVGHANEGFELPGLGEFFRPLSGDTTALRARRLGTLTTRRHRGNCVAP
jgi:hypothetical protein